MGKVLKLSTVLVAALAQMGCQSLDEEAAQSGPANRLSVMDITALDRPAPDNAPVVADETEQYGLLGQPPVYSSVQGTYKGRPLSKHVGDYVKVLTQDLVANMEVVNNQTPVGVTHFALLDSALNKTNLLGQQMAESFVHELHKFRIPVIDFKATDFIRVTPEGDFLLTRDYLELETNLPLEFVLTGTMARHQGGVMVNARIIGIESHSVVASAQMLIPYYVADALIPSDGNESDSMGGRIKFSKG
ncbi:FlgO family outer membrane protein [Alteromonas gilva]|uniref:FlgO family outer membrane protein n=1 Tax=Alteromonas gilva TaxID=2987522 RepID=A0ABT5L4D1_9ALTE|nr:FlgO family outer membrane protein [Alteromonas gilva]MDC8830633.1 FlgO family outer membrane protein [Alteromonas gilva]